MKKEIWKDIEGYEGLYEVSSYGRVRSLDRVVTNSNGKSYSLKGKILKMCFCGSGYLNLSLHRNGKTEYKYPHRLVAEAFIPNHSNLPQVNHKDEVKTNNHVENLEWCDGKYNVNYGTRNKRDAEKKSKTVIKIDMNTNEIIEEYQSAKYASRQTHLSQGHISACCRGEQRHYKGFKWRYQD